MMVAQKKNINSGSNVNIGEKKTSERNNKNFLLEFSLGVTLMNKNNQTINQTNLQIKGKRCAHDIKKIGALKNTLQTPFRGTILHSEFAGSSK